MLLLRIKKIMMKLKLKKHFIRKYKFMIEIDLGKIQVTGNY